MRSLGAPEGALGSARSRVCNCYPVILLVGRKAQTGPRRRKHYKNLRARHQELDAVHRRVCIPLLSSDSSGLILLSGVSHVLRWEDTWTAGQSGAATNSSPAPAAAALAWGRHQVTAFLLTRYLQALGCAPACSPLSAPAGEGRLSAASSRRSKEQCEPSSASAATWQLRRTASRRTAGGTPGTSLHTVLVKGRRSQCLSDPLRPGLLHAGRSVCSQEAYSRTSPT